MTVTGIQVTSTTFDSVTATTTSMYLEVEIKGYMKLDFDSSLTVS